MLTLDKILKLEPSKIFPGHGPVIDNPRVKIVEYVQHRLQREEQILNELQKVQPNGLTAEELVSLIYVVSTSCIFLTWFSHRCSGPCIVSESQHFPIATPTFI